MVNTIKPQVLMMGVTAAVLAMTLLCGQALAQGAAVQGPTAGQAVITSRGPAFVTGNLGSWETTTLPGRSGPGFLTNNGNGTSTLIVPGGLPQVVPRPR